MPQDRARCARCSQHLRPGEVHRDAGACLPAVLDALDRADRCDDPDCERQRPRLCVACAVRRGAGQKVQALGEALLARAVSAATGGAPDAAAPCACGCPFEAHEIRGDRSVLVCSCGQCAGYLRGRR